MTFTHRADRWICPDGSILLLDADLEVYVSDIQVTLTEAWKAKGGGVEYWHRPALIGWVSRNQEFLRAEFVKQLDLSDGAMCEAESGIRDPEGYDKLLDEV